MEEREEGIKANDSMLQKMWPQRVECRQKTKENSHGVLQLARMRVVVLWLVHYGPVKARINTVCTGGRVT